ncbi:MAG TPA: MobF family relaxase [Acidimicrobiales bacterium]|nr:MobF family relaxase [Acidimicrobiales bacterium]
MIRSSPIRADAEAYYLGIVSEGVEGPGRWIGRGVPDLGLAGEVGREHLAAVLGGRHPFTGATLHIRPVRVRGLELTFQVPKSVSVMWAVAGPDVAQDIDAGRSAALDAAVSYLEDEAVVLGANGRSAGMVGAAFAHRTSRSGDPHLHAHVIVANLGRASGGRSGWMAVDRLVLEKHLHTAGHLFEAHLRHELSERLGVRFGPVRAGVAQIEGVPAAVCRRFSQRRLQVEAVMAAHGGSSASAARLAALIDRPDRHSGLSADLLAPEWQERARDAGFDRDRARAAMGRGPAARAHEPSRPVEDVLGLTGLSTFSRRDILRAVCVAHPDGIPAEVARRTVDEVLGSPGVLRLTGRTPLRREDVLRTEQGRVVVVATDRERWTTRADVDGSRRAAALAEHLRGRSRVAVDGTVADGLLAAEPGLSAAQREVVREVTRSRDGVQVLSAPAGPGREQVLAACRRLWSAQGFRVLGTSPESAGARRLEESTGIDSAELGEVVGRLAPLAAPVVTPTVIVVDRAVELVSTDLLHVLETARRTDVGVVLVGDPGHIPEVDRASGWRAVADAVGARELQRDPRRDGPGRDAPTRQAPAREASLEPGGALYRVGDRLALSEAPSTLRAGLVADWRSQWDGTPRSVMVAGGRADVADLNQRARDLLRRDGALDDHRIRIGGLDAHGGDLVVVARLDGAARRLGWQAGQAWRVLPGAEGLAGPDGTRREVGSTAGLQLRWGYAATPYQARQVGAQDWLVLGAPGAPSLDAGGTGARYYVVAELEAGVGLAATLDRQDSRRHRMAALARSAELDPAPYLVAALGPPPGGPEARSTWRAAAGAVEAYRDRWGVGDRREPLGADPTAGRGMDGGGDRVALQQAERQEVVRLLRSAALRLGRAPDTGRQHGREREHDLGRER